MRVYEVDINEKIVELFNKQKITPYETFRAPIPVDIKFKIAAQPNVSACFSPQKPDIIIVNSLAAKCADSMQFVLLHELGHAMSHKIGLQPQLGSPLMTDIDYCAEEMAADMFAIKFMQQENIIISEQITEDLSNRRLLLALSFSISDYNEIIDKADEVSSACLMFVTEHENVY